MTAVGPGVIELRIRTGVEHRVFYVARLEEAVYVLHTFDKRTRKTPKRDLDLARARLRSLLAHRIAERKAPEEKP